MIFTRMISVLDAYNQHSQFRLHKKCVFLIKIQKQLFLKMLKLQNLRNQLVNTISIYLNFFETIYVSQTLFSSFPI